MCNDNLHLQRLRTDRQAAHTFDRTDDAARALLGTTCMPRYKTKCMRMLLAENVCTAPTNVGKLPRDGERGDSQGGPSPSAVAAQSLRGRQGKGGRVRRILANRQGNERGYREGASGVRGAGFAGRGELGKVEARLRGRLCAAGGTRT